MSSTRLEKVNSLLEHEISQLIAKHFDFSESLVTITHVDTTANLIEARAYVSVMPSDRVDKIIAVLNKGVYAIQKEVNKKLNMRPIPKIMFVKDVVIAEAAKIEGLLAQLKKEEK